MFYIFNKERQQYATYLKDGWQNYIDGEVYGFHSAEQAKRFMSVNPCTPSSYSHFIPDEIEIVEA